MHDVDLSVTGGRIHAIVGRNGAEPCHGPSDVSAVATRWRRVDKVNA